MDTQAQDLLAAALKLPADAREDLAIRLMGSVAPTESQETEIKQSWAKEIDRRMAEFESGEAAAIPIEEAWPKIAGKTWPSQAPGPQSSDNS